MPDYLNLELKTVPNILLVNIISQTYAPGSGVTGQVEIKNPLNTYYLALSMPTSENLIFTPSRSYDSIWGDVLHLVPPGDSVLYNFKFNSTSQTAYIESNL